VARLSLKPFSTTPPFVDLTKVLCEDLALDGIKCLGTTESGEFARLLVLARYPVEPVL
jgi:hypothetical protein